jgi:hypothetical protein
MLTGPDALSSFQLVRTREPSPHARAWSAWSARASLVRTRNTHDSLQLPVGPHAPPARMLSMAASRTAAKEYGRLG